jgi:hypothetical protein
MYLRVCIDLSSLHLHVVVRTHNADLHVLGDVSALLLLIRCTKRVKRLSLWMDSEIADTFFHRLQLAQHIKQVANAQRRLHAFVGGISADSFAVLQSKVVEGVIRRLMRSNERLVTSFQRAVEVILAEVNDNFNYAMRSAVLLYRHLDATEVCPSFSLLFLIPVLLPSLRQHGFLVFVFRCNRPYAVKPDCVFFPVLSGVCILLYLAQVRRSRSLRFPDLPTKPLAPLLGVQTLPVDRWSFALVKKEYAAQHFRMAFPCVQHVLTQLQRCWFNLSQHHSAFYAPGTPIVLQRFLYVGSSLGATACYPVPNPTALAEVARALANDPAGHPFHKTLTLPINLFRFQDLQEEQVMELQERLEKEWRDFIINQIRDHCAQFDLFQRDPEAYKSSPLFRLVKLLTVMMRDQLSDLVEASLADALHFWQQWANPILPPLLKDSIEAQWAEEKAEQDERDRLAALERARLQEIAEQLAEEERLAAEEEARLLAEEEAEAAREQAEMEALARGETPSDSKPSTPVAPQTPEPLPQVPEERGEGVSEEGVVPQDTEGVEMAATAPTPVPAVRSVPTLLATRRRAEERREAQLRNAERLVQLHLDRPVSMPFFLVKMTAQGGKVVYTPDLESFDGVIQSVLDIPSKLSTTFQIENSVVPLLGLPEVPLCSAQMCPHIFKQAEAVQAEVGGIFKYNLTAVRALKSLYEKHQDLLTMRTETTAQDWFAGRRKISRAERVASGLPLYYPDNTSISAYLLKRQELDAVDSDDEAPEMNLVIPANYDLLKRDPFKDRVAEAKEKAEELQREKDKAAKRALESDEPPEEPTVYTDAEIKELCTDSRGVVYDYVRQERSIADTLCELERLAECMQKIRDISSPEVHFPMVTVQVHGIQGALLLKLKRLIYKLLQGIVVIVNSKNLALEELFGKVYSRALTPNKDVRDLAKLRDYLLLVDNQYAPARVTLICTRRLVA